MVMHELLHAMFDLSWLQVAVFLALLSVCYELYRYFIKPILAEVILEEIQTFKTAKQELEQSVQQQQQLKQELVMQMQKIDALQTRVKIWQAAILQEQQTREAAKERVFVTRKQRLSKMLENFSTQRAHRESATKTYKNFSHWLQNTDHHWPDILEGCLQKWQHHE